MSQPHIVDFRNVATLQDFAVAIGVDDKLLARAMSPDALVQGPDALYIRHLIPKRRGSTGATRLVWDVGDKTLRDAHRAFARRFDDFLTDTQPNFPHPAAYGYVRGRGIKANATPHCGAKRLLSTDLKGFFPSITKARLVARLLQLGVPRSGAELIASFATIEGSLALGLNGSPTLANLICSRLDERLTELAARHGSIYTRYADDISISGDQVPDLATVTDVVESEGFQVAVEKSRIAKRGQALFVTGLSVTDVTAPHVPRAFKRRLRQELYFARKHGIQDHLRRIKAPSLQKGVNRLDGSVQFVSSVEAASGERMKRTWNGVLSSAGLRVSYLPRHQLPPSDVTFIVDEAEFEAGGRRILALACVTTEKIELLRAATAALLRKHAVDPFSPARKGALQRKGMHFADVPEDVRSEFAAFLPYLPFRAYVAFGVLDEHRSYESLYLQLLTSILPRRLRDADRARVIVVCETNPQVPRANMSDLISMLYAGLERDRERRPLENPNVKIASKQEEPAVAVPDFLLGIFARCFSDGRSAGAADRMRFERLRDKYRHIANIDTGQLFSRRHPIDLGTPIGGSCPSPAS